MGDFPVGGFAIGGFFFFYRSFVPCSKPASPWPLPRYTPEVPSDTPPPLLCSRPDSTYAKCRAPRRRPSHLTHASIHVTCFRGIFCLLSSLSFDLIPHPSVNPGKG
jgi:hypothetical protein